MFEPSLTAAGRANEHMANFTDIDDRAGGCDCDPRCLDIASGVLMYRHGLTGDEARSAVLRSARSQRMSVHATSLAVMDSAANGGRASSPG